MGKKMPRTLICIVLTLSLSGTCLPPIGAISSGTANDSAVITSAYAIAWIDECLVLTSQGISPLFEEEDFEESMSAYAQFYPVGTTPPASADDAYCLYYLSPEELYTDEACLPEDGDYALWGTIDDGANWYKGGTLYRVLNGDVVLQYVTDDPACEAGQGAYGAAAIPSVAISSVSYLSQSTLCVAIQLNLPQLGVSVEVYVNSVDGSYDMDYYFDLDDYTLSAGAYQVNLEVPYQDGRFLVTANLPGEASVPMPRGFIVYGGRFCPNESFSLEQLGTLAGNLIVEPLEIPAYMVATPTAIASPSTYINLKEETLLLSNEFDFQSFSLDGGKKWQNFDNFKPGDPTEPMGVSISKLLDNGLTLWLANTTYNKNTKSFPADTGFIKFPKIAKRPDLPILTVNYQAPYMDQGVLDYDVESDGENYWGLTPKTSNEMVYDNLQIAASPDYFGYNWFDMSGQGVLMKPLGVVTNRDGETVLDKNGHTIPKVQKTLYYYRTEPILSGDTYFPASKMRKIIVSGLDKPKAAKVDYTKEVVKLPKGVLVGGFLADIVTGKVTDTQSKGISIAPYMGEAFTYCTPPTLKRPASAVVHYQTLARNTGFIIPIQKGALVPDKNMVFSVNGREFGPLKKLTGAQGSTTITVKYKALARATGLFFAPDGDFYIDDTAKLIKVGNTTVTPYAASAVASLTYTWGIYDTRNNKELYGVTAVTISE